MDECSVHKKATTTTTTTTTVKDNNSLPSAPSEEMDEEMDVLDSKQVWTRFLSMRDHGLLELKDCQEFMRYFQKLQNRLRLGLKTENNNMTGHEIEKKKALISRAEKKAIEWEYVKTGYRADQSKDEKPKEELPKDEKLCRHCQMRDAVPLYQNLCDPCFTAYKFKNRCLKCDNYGALSTCLYFLCLTCCPSTDCKNHMEIKYGSTLRCLLCNSMTPDEQNCSFLLCKTCCQDPDCPNHGKKVPPLPVNTQTSNQTHDPTSNQTHDPTSNQTTATPVSNTSKSVSFGSMCVRKGCTLRVKDSDCLVGYCNVCRYDISVRCKCFRCREETNYWDKYKKEETIEGHLQSKENVTSLRCNICGNQSNNIWCYVCKRNITSYGYNNPNI